MAPSYVALGDVNGDGILDIVTTNAGSDDVSVLLGKEDGTFFPEKRFVIGTGGFAGGGFPGAVELAGLNGEILLDILAIS